MKRTADILNNQVHHNMLASNDLSVLRKPIKTSVTGLHEARKAYDNGTEEIRKLLSNECDIIYECKICRNMFRSLANFISHKRIYCKATYNTSFHMNSSNDGDRFGNDIATIVQAENDFIGNVRNGKNNEKDLSSIIERLVKREKANRMMKLSDFYEQVNNKLTQDEILQKRYVLQLDVVPDSNVAVYQTVKGVSDRGEDEGEGDTIKNEVMEIQGLMDKSRIVLGSDGKIVSAIDLPKFGSSERPQPFECEICNNKFLTEKTLKLHIETKHISSTYVFQCPSCNKTFLQVGQVIRHLTNDHKKSMRRVRLMRDSILKRRTRIDEVPVRGPSRELARLQTDKDLVDSQNKAWLDNLENNQNGANICMFCGKKFERKAVLFSHHKVCQLKKKPSSRILLTKKIDSKLNLNVWNDRELDDSSNSNSLDAHYSDENSRQTIIADKLNKTEKLIKTEVDDSADNAITNKRKRNRTVKSIVNDDVKLVDDDESLNICWNNDRLTTIKEEGLAHSSILGIPEPITSSNSLDNIEMDFRTNVLRGDKKTGATNGSKMRIALTSSHCKYCFKKFSTASNLRRHINMMHSGPKKFTCNLCKNGEFRARRQTDVISHMRAKHPFDGEKTVTFGPIVMNEESFSSKQTPSINRRKERHTEVLQDDEGEIFIESETFSPTTERDSSDNIVLMDTSNENSNFETDDSLVTIINEITYDSIEINSKRKGRPKTREKVKKVEIAPSIDNKKGTETVLARRPVRNRTMPVKKDFVYDLSTILKKDYRDFQPDFQKQTVPQPSQKTQHTNHDKSVASSPTSFETMPSRRQNTFLDVIQPVGKEQSWDEKTAKEDLSKSLSTEQTSAATSKNEIVLIPLDTELNSIKGSATVMAERAVKSNRAMFFKAPDLPVERPMSATLVIPQRKFEPTKMKDWPVLKRPVAVFDEMKPKLSNIKVPGLKRKKRSCMLKQVTSNKSPIHRNRSNERKNNTNGQGNKRPKCNSVFSTTETVSKLKISTQLVDKILMQSAQTDTELKTDTNTLNNSLFPIELDSNKMKQTIEPHPLSTTVTSTTTATAATSSAPRRMTLLERLAENKTKKLNESLSRMTIGNSDNESDENSE